MMEERFTVHNTMLEFQAWKMGEGGSARFCTAVFGVDEGTSITLQGRTTAAAAAVSALPWLPPPPPPAPR